MRVALLTNFVPPYRVPLFEALRDRVGELRVLVSTRMESDRSWVVSWQSLDVVVQRTLTFKPRGLDGSSQSRRSEVHLPFDALPQLWSWAPDVVISSELGLRSLQAAAFCAFRPQIPLLIWATLSEHTEKARGKLRRELRSVILKRADGVLVNGESGARYIHRFGVDDKRIFRVNQPVDIGLFAAEWPRPMGQHLRLLFSGTLTEYKGVRHFATQLAAWAHAHPCRQVELWWLGEGPLRSWLEGQKLPGNLTQRFCGAVQYDQVAEFYAKCDALVLPSLGDEWGLVINEALASGLPVLGSIYSQAVEELVEEGQTGWKFDPLSTESAFAALDRMFATERGQFERMREATRRRVSRLTPATAADRIAEAIAQVTAARKANGARRRG